MCVCVCLFIIFSIIFNHFVLISATNSWMDNKANLVLNQIVISCKSASCDEEGVSGVLGI